MKWKINNCVRVYDGHFKVDQVNFQHELYSGDMSNELTRERVTRKNSVAVLPYDPDRDEIVLIEQFRVGAMEQDDNPWLLEIIAGLVEPGEEYETVAKREALEEANCTLQELKYITSFFPTPGGFTELSHVYIAKTETRGLSGIYGLDEEGEDIRVYVVPASQSIELLQQGKIRSAIPMIAIHNFLLMREKLQQEWKSR